MTEANQTGRVVWHDLMSTDPEKSEAFYVELLGWDVDPVDMGPMGTYRIVGPGKGLGGIMPLDGAAGVPPHWVSYFSTATVDETTAKAAELGATIGVPPMDIPNVGRFSVVIDPQGAAFSPFTDTAGMSPPDGEIPSVGGVSWNELLSTDAKSATSFYADLFGYTPKEQDMGTGPYTILYRGDAMEAGILQNPDPSSGMPSAWVIYFVVANLDESLAKLEQLGGQNVSGIIEVPGIGRVAMVADSLGAFFGLHEPAPAA